MKRQDIIENKMQEARVEISLDIDARLMSVNTKMHTLRLFPYLHKEYRKLDEKELDNKETLKELFGDAERNIEKLMVVFAYQNFI